MKIKEYVDNMLQIILSTSSEDLEMGFEEFDNRISKLDEVRGNIIELERLSFKGVPEDLIKQEIFSAIKYLNRLEGHFSYNEESTLTCICTDILEQIQDRIKSLRAERWMAD